MQKEHIFTRKWGDRRSGKTDWAHCDALTDKDIEAAIANDPDWEAEAEETRIAAAVIASSACDDGSSLRALPSGLPRTANSP